MAEGAAVICEMAAYLLQGYCLQYFFGSFLEGRLSGARKTAVIVSVSYGVMKAASAYLLPAGGESSGSFYRLMLHSVLLAVLVFGCYRAAKTIAVFLYVTFLALNEISFFIGYMVMSLSSPVLTFETEIFMRGYIADAAFEHVIRFTAAFLQILCCFLWVLVLWFSLRRVVSAFREKEYEMHRTELLFILTPGLVGFLLCVLLRIIMITVEDGRPALLYDRYPVLRVLIPAVLLLTLLSILYSVKLFQDMILLGRERNSRIILEQQIENMQENVGETTRVYAEVRSLKHDMKNTVAVLQRLAADESGGSLDDSGSAETDESEVDNLHESRLKNAELRAYLAELNRSFDRLEFRFRTGNAVADALLNMKYYEMRRYFAETAGGGAEDFKFEFDAERLIFPENLAIQSYDIGVILGNALDNAIEACMRLVKEKPQTKPFIRLSSFQKGKFFFLEIENSFDGRLKKSSHSEFPSTLKSEKQIHGIGFANMKKTAEKYDGAVDYSVGNTDGTNDASGFAIFTLTIMMKNNGQADAAG